MTENILPPLTTIWVSAPAHLKQCISSVSPFRLNEAFECWYFLGLSHNELCFLCSSPLPCKIYEKCPGAHEMLPRLILCDEVTTVSVPQQEPIQDGVHWSLREEETRKGREKGARVKGEWRKGAGRGGVDGDEDFFAFRTTNDSSRSSGGEWKRLVSPAFQLRSEPVDSHSWITQSLSLSHSFPRCFVWFIGRNHLYWAMGSCSYHALSRALSSLTYSH